MGGKNTLTGLFQDTAVSNLTRQIKLKGIIPSISERNKSRDDNVI